MTINMCRQIVGVVACPLALSRSESTEEVLKGTRGDMPAKVCLLAQEGLEDKCIFCAVVVRNTQLHISLVADEPTSMPVASVGGTRAVSCG